MADYYNGNFVVKSVDKPKDGWLPVNGNNAVPVPDCPVRYWKFSADGKSIVEMSDDEKTAIDTPPQPELTVYEKIKEALTDAEFFSLEAIYRDYPFFGLGIRNNDFSLAGSELSRAVSDGAMTQELADKIGGALQ